jgi:hypothetical protein
MTPVKLDHPFGVLDRRRAVGIIEPPPSWIRIEPCAMPRSLPFGGFWKKFGVCVSPSERFEEWVGVASHSFISYRAVGLVAIGLVEPARYSPDRKASSQRSQFGRLVELSRGAADALFIWTAAFGIKRAICRVDSFKALSGIRNGASNGEIIRLALDHERISAGRKHEVFLLWPYC